MPRKLLTDSQLWLVMNTPNVVSDDDLANAIGSTRTTIHGARWRLKNEGWTCRVSYGICSICDQPFTRQGSKTGRRQYHEDCRPIVLKQIRPIHDRAKWKRMSDTEQQAILDRAHQHNVKHQQKTVGSDHNRMRRWTIAEDAAILDPDALPDHELAIQLGRTLYAVRGRRLKLRQRRSSPQFEPSDTSA